MHEDYATHEKGTQLGGDSVSMMAGHDLNVNGSSVIADSNVRYYNDGRVAYLDSTTRTVVIRNPGKGESTAFRPDYDIGWDNYIKRLPTQNTPPMN